MPGGEGAHGLQLLKAAVAQHGGAELGHQVDELEEGGEPLKVTLFLGEEAGAAGQ